MADKANPAKRIRVAIFFIRLVNWFAFGYWLKFGLCGTWSGAKLEGKNEQSASKKIKVV
ncbi:MAG: hypothetical protein VZR22_00370 [Candidatus Cryptobacteroides sp.]|nr:hypothetical protein [Candidatus Cryptobacteroides sp.]